jgi:hypothetical protein
MEPTDQLVIRIFADWIFPILGWLCLGVFVLKTVGLIWVVRQLRRKSVPELWGIDWLDILFRLERLFQVTFEKADFEAIPPDHRQELTAGGLWAIVAAKLSAAGRPLPKDGWDKFVTALTEALNVKRTCVRPESRLYRDLHLNPQVG